MRAGEGDGGRARAATLQDMLVVVLVSGGSALAWLRHVMPDWEGRTATRGDGPFQAWTIDWVQGAILGRHPLWSAGIYHPSPRSLAFSDHLIGVAAALLPLRALGLSPAGQLNTAIVVGTVLDAVAAYLMVRVLLRRRAAAVVAGVAFAVGPFQHFLTLQLHMLWRPGLPVGVALVWVLADRHRGALRWPGFPRDRWLGVLLALVVGWQGLVSFYDAVLVALALAVVVAVRWRDLGRAGVGRVALAAAAGGSVVAVTLVPYLENARTYDGFGRTLQETQAFRGRLLGVELTNSTWAGILSTGSGIPAFLGATLMGLAVIGAGAAIRARVRSGPAGPEWAAARFGLVATILGAILALGASAEGWGRFTPFGIAFRFVPGFAVVRASGRLWVLGLLGMVVLAGLGTSVLVDAVASFRQDGASTAASPPGWRVVAVVVVVALLAGFVVEGWSSPEPAGDARTHAVDTTLAERPGTAAVAYLPIGSADFGRILGEADAVYRSTRHGRPILNGYSGYAPPSANVLAGRLEALPGPEAMDCLRATGTGYVVVTPAVVGTPWQKLLDPAAAGPLVLVQRAGGELLYAVPPGSGSGCPLPGP